MSGIPIPAPDEDESMSQEPIMMNNNHPGSVSRNYASSNIYDDDSVEENTNRVRQKLIETGQMDRLKDLMERRLSEVGWRTDMMARCREIVQKHGPTISYETLFQALRQEGRDRVPADVTADVLEKIKYCFESETKDN